MSISRSELTGFIKAKARELGFQHIGIAPADALTIEADHFLTWLGQGSHAGMHWMERDPQRRTDPGLVVPGARAVICVALNYYTPYVHSGEPGTGKISRYAWGDDYHDVLQERLAQLLVFIQSVAPGAEGRYYVDTGPVLEKAWAQRAGIGWIGKHTNVISQEYGSWMFLGELILNVDLEYDSPATDHCGTCTLCIDACPTDAITEPYVVDANKCISYLTIEHRGPLDPKFTGQFENWVYGCDICQDVCPWNHKFATSTDEPPFQPRAVNLNPILVELTEMTDEEFKQRYSKSSMKRTKIAGLKRNAEFLMTASTMDQEGEASELQSSSS